MLEKDFELKKNMNSLRLMFLQSVGDKSVFPSFKEFV